MCVGECGMLSLSSICHNDDTVYFLFHLHLFVSPMMRSKNSSVKNRRKKSCGESLVPAGKRGPACVL